MTNTIKNLNDSDLELACGGSTLLVDAMSQAVGARLRPDAADGDVTAGNQGGGSAAWDSVSQNAGSPDSAL